MQLSRPSIINVQHKFDILKIMGFIDRRPHTRVYSVMDHMGQMWRKGNPWIKLQ